MSIEINLKLINYINSILTIPPGFSFSYFSNPLIENKSFSLGSFSNILKFKLYSMSNLEFSILEEMIWQSYFINYTRNGNIILNNIFFNDIEERGEFYGLHITTSLDDILKSKEIKQSSGCLPNTIYITPYNGRIHNLTKSILSKELSFLNKNISILLFKLYNFERKPNLCSNGFDSQLLGELYFEIFEKLKNKISSIELINVMHNIENQCFELKILLERCCNYTYIEKINSAYFLKIYLRFMKKFEILCGFYFEAISEYVLLYQDDGESIFLNTIGEFNNNHHKSILFEMNNNLKGKFNIYKFCPNLNEVYNYIVSKGFIGGITKNHFYTFLKYRLSHMIRYKLIRSDSIISNCLKGNLIYLYFKKYFKGELLSLFYKLKKEYINNYRNESNVILPFRNTIPKGEIGINTSRIDFDYDIYLVDIIKDNIKIKEKLDVKFVNSTIEENRKNMTSK